MKLKINGIYMHIHVKLSLTAWTKECELMVKEYDFSTQKRAYKKMGATVDTNLQNVSSFPWSFAVLCAQACILNAVFAFV